VKSMQENDARPLHSSVNRAAAREGLAPRDSRAVQRKPDGAKAGPHEADRISPLSQRDCDAFYELVRPHERALFVIALSILGRQAEAEEVVQDAVAKAFCEIATFSGRSEFGAWLRQLVIEEAKMKLRREHRPLYDLFESEHIRNERDYTPGDFRAWREIPSSALHQDDMRNALVKAVLSLPPLCRSVFVLRDVQQLSIQDTAMLLGLADQAVKALLSRARLEIREALAPGLGGPWSKASHQHGKRIAI
jgi:RNA polymerase sigma-70 factor, ECF subfamily